MKYRHPLFFVIGALLTSGWTAEPPRPAQVVKAPAVRTASLAKTYAPYFAIGAAIPSANLSPAEQQLLFKHFSTLTPENCMKPYHLQRAEKQFEFAKADALVAMARKNSLTINGHTLLWHNQCPEWFFKQGEQAATREQVLARMRTHIATVAGHFAGKVKSWDVVNEAIDDGKNYLRNTQWLSHIGEDYLAEAFIAAHKADPKAELYYNDYGIEMPAKREKTLRLIRDLKKRKAPLHGIGIQGHWTLDRIPFKEIEAAIIAFHAEGLQVMITELDVDVVPRKTSGAEAGTKEENKNDPYAKGLSPEAQKRLAEQYAQLFSLFLKHHEKISRVTFWGLHDGRSWLNNWPSKRTNHALMWDRNLNSKPALTAVLELPKPSVQQLPRGAQNK
jgi:endo-1,4-beta-xylanase